MPVAHFAWRYPFRDLPLDLRVCGYARSGAPALRRSDAPALRCDGWSISAAGLRALGRPASECRVRCAPRCRGRGSSARMWFERAWAARARHVSRLCGSVMAGAALVGPWQPTRHRRDLGTCGPWVLLGLTVVVRFGSCDAVQDNQRAERGHGEVCCLLAQRLVPSIIPCASRVFPWADLVRPLLWWWCLSAFAAYHLHELRLVR